MLWADDKINMTCNAFLSSRYIFYIIMMMVCMYHLKLVGENQKLSYGKGEQWQSHMELAST